jgi:hypothetical protein
MESDRESESRDNELRSRNARLRSAVEALMEKAPEDLKVPIRKIAGDQSPPAEAAAETLQMIYEHLSARARVLIEAGFAKREDFSGLI